MRRTILSIRGWQDVHRFNGDYYGKPGDYAFPMSTDTVLKMLDECGLQTSAPTIERIVKTMSLVVPKLGRTRAWGEAQVTSLIDFIVSNQIVEQDNQADAFNTPTHFGLPTWMKPHAAMLYRFGIAADSWARAHMDYLRETAVSHPPLVFAQGHAWTLEERKARAYSMINWFDVPAGAALLLAPPSSSMAPDSEIMLTAEELAAISKSDKVPQMGSPENGDFCWFRFVPLADVEKHLAKLPGYVDAKKASRDFIADEAKAMNRRMVAGGAPVKPAKAKPAAKGRK